jgi:hypothetical protein
MIRAELVSVKKRAKERRDNFAVVYIPLLLAVLAIFEAVVKQKYLDKKCGTDAVVCEEVVRCCEEGKIMILKTIS